MKVSDEYKLSSLDDPKRKAFERKRNYPLKIYETTLRNGQVVRIMANDHYEAREMLKQGIHAKHHMSNPFLSSSEKRKRVVINIDEMLSEKQRTFI